MKQIKLIIDYKDEEDLLRLADILNNNDYLFEEE